MDKIESPLEKETILAMEELSKHGVSLGIPQTIDSFLKTIDLLILTEVENRKFLLNEKLKKKGKLKKKDRNLKDVKKKEEELHQKSVSQIEQTIKIFREERKKIKKEYHGEINNVVKDKEKFKEIKDHGSILLENFLFNGTVDPDMALEIIEINEEVFDKVDSEKGVDSILDNIERELIELKRVRIKEKDKGRIDHSPILWWKAVLIAVTIGVSVWLIIDWWIKSIRAGVPFLTYIVTNVGAGKIIHWLVKGILAWC